MKGLVLKGIGGFYFVETDQGVYRAKARGLFKKDRNILMVGDEVEVQIAKNADDDSWITGILARKNHFNRPPIANVDKLVIVFAAANPDPNYAVIDKMLIMAENKGIIPIVCINKADLVEESEAERISAIYANIYPTYLTKAKTGEGIDSLRNELSGSKVALAGPSGVGKSTIINAIIPEACMEVGDISEKTLRGRHTTRHVEMMKLEDGYIFDTPGFTSLDLDREISSQEVARCYPEMRSLMHKCRFNDCTHASEPDCAIIEAVENGKISKTRYNTYLNIVAAMEGKR